MLSRFLFKSWEVEDADVYITLTISFTWQNATNYAICNIQGGNAIYKVAKKRAVSFRVCVYVCMRAYTGVLVYTFGFGQA